MRLFALAFLTQACITFAYDITHIHLVRDDLAAAFPPVAFDRDLAIVVTNARLTIALIPVALVWFAASRIARWLVVLFAFGKLAVALYGLGIEGPGGSGALVSLFAVGLAFAGAALLLTPGAARWFARSSAPLPEEITQQRR